MSVLARPREKRTSRLSSTYDHWLRKIINEGLMDNYIIEAYPELVQLRIKEIDGKLTNDKILSKKDAEKMINQSPNSYDYVELNVKKIMLNDLEKSRLIKYKKIISERKSPFIKFLFLAPLLSKFSGKSISSYINGNINVILVISNIVIVMLMILGIFVPLYLAGFFSSN